MLLSDKLVCQSIAEVMFTLVSAWNFNLRKIARGREGLRNVQQRLGLSSARDNAIRINDVG